jgi:hypothetical protein
MRLRIGRRTTEKSPDIVPEQYQDTGEEAVFVVHCRNAGEDVMDILSEAMEAKGYSVQMTNSTLIRCNRE